MLKELAIESLVLDHAEIRKKGVGKYAMRLSRGEEPEPVSVVRCIHDRNNYLLNGHHRTVANHFLRRWTIVGEVTDCVDEFDCQGRPYDCRTDNSSSIHDIKLR